MSIRMKCAITLIEKELFLFFKGFRGKVIDSSILLFSSVAVFSYFMNSSGLDANYGTFFFVSSIASFGLYEVLWKATVLAQEILDKKIQNYLILPLRACSVFVTIAISWSITLILQVGILIPIGKLMLFNRLNLSNFVSVKFLLIFIVANLFYGFFALWIASLIKDLRTLSWIGSRVILPLMMFSCYYYSWQSVYEMSRPLSYLQLLNPLVYAVEGTRAAVLGQTGFLNYWVCLGVLLSVMSIMLFDGIFRLRRRTASI